MKATEKRFYIINDHCDNYQFDCSAKNLTDEEFMLEAEKQGTIYSEKGFVELFNDPSFGYDIYNLILRIIDIEV